MERERLTWVCGRHVNNCVVCIYKLTMQRSPCVRPLIDALLFVFFFYKKFDSKLADGFSDVKKT